MKKTKIASLVLAALLVCLPASAALDTFKNHEKGYLTAGIDAVATTVNLTTGGGARFATGANAVIWNATDYPDPSDDPNREIVRITGIAGDVLTVSRAQETTSAATHNTAGKQYVIIAGATAKTFNVDIPATFAPIASPTFTGTVTIPTPFTLGATSVTTTGTVLNLIAAATSTTGTTNSNIVFSASPTFTGVPTAPTAAVDTNTTQLATTAYVVGNGYLKSATAASTYAPLSSPALTGTPTAPTATGGTNTTQLATTAFVATSFAPLASPTFSGTVTDSNSGDSAIVADATNTTGKAIDRLRAGNGTTSSNNAYNEFILNGTTPQTWQEGAIGNLDWSVKDATGSRTPISADHTTGLVTFANGTDNAAGDLRLKGGKLQVFTIRINDTAGTLQSAIFAHGGATATLGNFAGQINGASATLTNLPTVDNVTPFANGAGIDSTGTSRLLFDTAVQTDADFAADARIELNSTGSAAPIVRAMLVTSTVNGVSRRRLACVFTNATTGAAYAITTANIPSGAALDIRVTGYIK